VVLICISLMIRGTGHHYSFFHVLIGHLFIFFWRHVYSSLFKTDYSLLCLYFLMEFRVVCVLIELS
jgi:hypothetical protein